MSFFYCIATLLEFAGVHYFTKVGSGEISMINDDEWEDIAESIEQYTGDHDNFGSPKNSPEKSITNRGKSNAIICPIYNVKICILVYCCCASILIYRFNFVLYINIAGCRRCVYDSFNTTAFTYVNDGAYYTN